MIRKPRKTFLAAATFVAVATVGTGVEAGATYTPVNEPKVIIQSGNHNQKVNCGGLPEGSRAYYPQTRGGRWIIDGRYYGVALQEDGCILVNPNW